MRQLGLKHKQSKIWCKPDIRLNERVPQGVLFGIKRMMVSWGYDKTSLWVDVPTGKLHLGSDTILTILLADGKFESPICGWLV